MALININRAKIIIIILSFKKTSLIFFSWELGLANNPQAESTKTWKWKKNIQLVSPVILVLVYKRTEIKTVGTNKKSHTDLVFIELECIVNSWRFYIPKFTCAKSHPLWRCTADYGWSQMPRLWTRTRHLRPAAPRTPSSASPDPEETRFGNHSQNKHRHVEKAAFPAGRRAPYNSTLTPNMCAWKWRRASGMQTQTCSRCFETCGQKVEPKPDRRFDLQVCLISWVLFVTSVCEADVFQTFCSRTSFFRNISQQEQEWSQKDAAWYKSDAILKIPLNCKLHFRAGSIFARVYSADMKQNNANWCSWVHRRLQWGRWRVWSGDAMSLILWHNVESVRVSMLSSHCEQSLIHSNLSKCWLNCLRYP